MIQTQINPAWIGPELYVEFLNHCFPGTWSLNSFHWYLSRRFAGRSTDIAVRTDGSRLLAMVAVCYRRVLTPDGNPIDVGIMLAGGTLPSEQRRGHYGALMQASLDIGRERACEALLGFVTRNNGSGRGLSRLGAHSIPSFYVSSTSHFRSCRAPAPADARQHRHVRMQLARISAPRSAESAGHLRFDYASSTDWEHQFIHRANPVRLVRPAHDSAALIETVGDVDRLQWLQCPAAHTIGTVAALAAASRHARRGFFMYTMDPLLARAAARLGLRVLDGYMKIMPVGTGAAESVKYMASLPWRLQSGDRM
jgi:hypothetical protein